MLHVTEKEEVNLLKNEDVGFICKRISERMQRYSSSDLREYGMTLVQFHVLNFLLQSEDFVSQKDLENYMETNHSSVAGIVSRLEDKGLVLCTRDSVDKRQKLLQVTEEGKKIYVTLQQSKDELNDKMVAGLSTNEIIQLKSLLERVYNNLEK